MSLTVTILGSGAAAPAHGRTCSAQLVNVGGCRLLIDCAEGTQHQMRMRQQKAMGLSAILISHLHGDHVLGLPGLLATLHLHGRTAPIDVFAPTGLRRMTETLLECTSTHLQYDLRLHELVPTALQPIYANAQCRVSAFPLLHSVPAIGFVVEEAAMPRNLRKEMCAHYALSPAQCVAIKGGADLRLADGTTVPNAALTLPPRQPRRYAYCCDTAYDGSLAAYVQGADMLCAECTFGDELAALAAEKRHLTATQAARLAAEAHAGTLLLTHFSARYKDVQPLVQAARRIFPSVVAAEDGMAMEVKPNTTDR